MKENRLFNCFVVKPIAFLFRQIIRLRYRVILKETDILKSDRPILFLPNHQALIDPFILLGNIYKYTSVLPAVSSKYYNIFFVKALFRKWGAISVSDLENGSRNVNVLQEVSRATLKGLRRGKNMVIYPSGQIANQGFEKIANKKTAFTVVSRLPENCMVVGIRIQGLWGSMWSKAKTGKSPDFFTQALKGIFYIIANLIFFLPRRNVQIEFVDITNYAKENTANGRHEFNQALELFYNVHGEEKLKIVPYHFIHFRKS
jgi:long-chain-fatty-acid--[acyl-carrier-protein] ligase